MRIYKEQKLATITKALWNTGTKIHYRGEANISGRYEYLHDLIEYLKTTCHITTDGNIIYLYDRQESVLSLPAGVTNIDKLKTLFGIEAAQIADNWILTGAPGQLEAIKGHLADSSQDVRVKLHTLLIKGDLAITIGETTDGKIEGVIDKSTDEILLSTGTDTSYKITEERRIESFAIIDGQYARQEDEITTAGLILNLMITPKDEEYYNVKIDCELSSFGTNDDKNIISRKGVFRARKGELIPFATSNSTNARTYLSLSGLSGSIGGAKTTVLFLIEIT